MPVTVINASPRLFSRHQRHKQFSRLNHSQQELAFLETQANRLGTTVLNIYNLLYTLTADEIVAKQSYP